MIDSEWIQNPDRLLTVFGAILFAVSVLYFGRETILHLSPLAKSFLLISASGLFLTGSRHTEDRGVQLAGYFFSAISYLTFLVYYIARMSPSSEVIFLMLAFSGIIFIAIGKKMDEYTPEKAVLKKIAIGVSLLGLAVIAADTAAPEPAYSLEFQDSATLGEEPVEIGAVTVENSYVLPQVYSIGNLNICGDRRFSVRPENYDEDDGVIDGSSTKSVNYRLSRYPREHNASSETFSIETVDECPEQVENSTVSIVREEDRLD